MTFSSLSPSPFPSAFTRFSPTLHDLFLKADWIKSAQNSGTCRAVKECAPCTEAVVLKGEVYKPKMIDLKKKKITFPVKKKREIKLNLLTKYPFLKSQPPSALNPSPMFNSPLHRHCQPGVSVSPCLCNFI